MVLTLLLFLTNFKMKPFIQMFVVIVQEGILFKIFSFNFNSKPFPHLDNHPVSLLCDDVVDVLLDSSVFGTLT